MDLKASHRIGAIVLIFVLAMVSVRTCYLMSVGETEIKEVAWADAERTRNVFIIKLPPEEILQAGTWPKGGEADSGEGENGSQGGGEAAGGDQQGEEGEAPGGDGLETEGEEGSEGEGDQGEGGESFENSQPSDIPDGSDMLILVNKENPINKQYVPEDLLRPDYCASNRGESGQYMVREAAEAFNELAGAAASEGYEIVVTTAYRSYNFQKQLYDGYVARRGIEYAEAYSAQPGKSEHQTGLAADVSSPSVNYELVTEFADTDEGKWLAENCFRYGFIIRYPKGMEAVTGYSYEPWHLRYVGQEAAREIFERELCLEEYLEELYLENKEE